MEDIKSLNIENFIVRRFTKELEKDKLKTVYDLFNWKTVGSKLIDYKTNKILYDEKDLEFPEQYSQNACDIIASKYFKRANIPNERGKEYSLKQVVHRMVRFWMEAGLDEGLLNETNAKIFYDEVAYMILDQRIAPNSPQWFNTGLCYYNTKEDSDGHFYYDDKEKKVKQSKDKYSRTQASACFILSLEDKLLGDKSISQQFVTETRLFKHGSGTGTNYSNLRAKGEKLSGGGTSSGAISFMKGLDRNAGTIKSGGTTRRAARMLQLDIDHPEILDFIRWKAEQENIVRDLGKMGYDISFDGVAYDTVSGQNGNNTVRFNDEFMKKVDLYKTKGIDSEFELKGRIDNSVNKKYKVSEIWNEFCKCAWECADPAPAFDDTFNAWHTCPCGEDGIYNAKYNRINSTNPCFTGDMKLLTIDGYKTFEELCDKEVDIINASNFTSKSKIWCSGYKEVIKLDFDNGKTIRCTPNHIFRLGNGKECEAKELFMKNISPFLDTEKDTKVIKIEFIGKAKVYDFSEPIMHWGVVEGFVVHNCGEYAFLDDTACNLASSNVKKFYNNDTKQFDIEAYKHCILLGQIILEVTIHWGQFPIEEVARKTHLFRTTGLGIANISSVFLLMGLPYDSEEARAVASGLTSLLTGYSYFTSSLIAKTLGTFEKYDINKKYMLEVIRNHARVSGARNDKYERLTYKPIKLNHNILHKLNLDNLSNIIKQVWEDTVNLGENYGFRNAQVSVIAPTGTIAFAMDCEATSIEPFFAHTIYKKLAGGGGMSIVNPLIPQTLQNLNYKKEDIDIITKQIETGNIENCDLVKEEHLAIFDTANKIGIGHRFISPMGHVKMMASLTPTVSGSISKTVNLPNEATIEDISNIFLESNKLGIKGITVYRDNCKATQPLNTAITDKTKDIKFEDMKYNDLVKIAYDLKNKSLNPIRRKPEGIRPANVHPAQIDGVDLYITISYYKDGSLAEVYVSADKEGGTIGGLLDSLSKQISKMLQYNIPIVDIIKSFKGQKYEPCGFVTGHPYIKFADSISDLIAKVLEIEIGNYSSCQVKPKNYIETKHITKLQNNQNNDIKIKKDEAKGEKVYGKTCPICGSSHMRKNGTCYVCEDCGSTTGCS